MFSDVCLLICGFVITLYKNESKPALIGPWSSGNSADFDSAIRGSNPRGSAIIPAAKRVYADVRLADLKARLASLFIR